MGKNTKSAGDQKFFSPLYVLWSLHLSNISIRNLVWSGHSLKIHRRPRANCTLHLFSFQKHLTVEGYGLKDFMWSLLCHRHYFSAYLAKDYCSIILNTQCCLCLPVEWFWSKILALFVNDICFAHRTNKQKWCISCLASFYGSFMRLNEMHWS